MPPKPKILYLITKGVWGGAQRYVFDLASAMKEAECEVVVASGQPGELNRRLEEAGIRSITLPGLSRDISFLREIRAFFALVSLLKKERPQVLHVNSSKAGLLGTLAGRVVGVRRIIFSSHGWSFNEARPKWERVIFYALHTLTIMLSHETVCVSEAVRKDIASRWTRRKLRVVRNGLTCTTLLDRASARAATVPEKTSAFWFGIVAELHKTKRIDVAVEALARITNKHPEAIVVVFGEGEERADLETLISEKNMKDRVFLPGFVKDGPAHLSAFDVLLLPSRTEALGYAVLEAGCARLPVIASNVGGLPEVIEDGMSGILLPPGNVEALTDAMRECIQNREKADALGEHLHARVIRDFSLERMVKETYALYGL